MATNERWTGWIGFAGLLLVIIAMLDFFEGLIAIIRGQYYAITPNQIVVFDLKTWGWITLIWAVIIGLTGFGLLSGLDLGTLDGDRADQHQHPDPARVRRLRGVPALGTDGDVPEHHRALRAHGSLERHARTGVRKYALAPGVRGSGLREQGLTPAV